MLEMPIRNIRLTYHIDTNRINARQKLDAMNQLEYWQDRGVINLEMSEVAMIEASSNQSSPRAKKAQMNIFSYTSNNTKEDENKLKEIELTIFPNGCKDQNQRNDVAVVYNASKYGHILITADGDSKKQPGGILGAKAALRKLGISVLRDTEAIEVIREAILSRDKIAYQVNDITSIELPEWVGKD